MAVSAVRSLPLIAPIFLKILELEYFPKEISPEIH